jgi:ubiquitin C-terminal hydrolase
VNFPLQFSFKPEYLSDDLALEEKTGYEQQRRHIYQLYAFILHEGKTPNEGHYFAIVYHNNGWLKYDDESVSRVKDPQTYLRKAYVLFYYRKWLIH